MRIDQTITFEPTLQAAVDELTGMIAGHYPSAVFQVSRHPDEAGTVLLDAIVDTDDTEPVNELIFERMEQLRLDQGVPLLVIPISAPDRRPTPTPPSAAGASQPSSVRTPAG